MFSLLETTIDLTSRWKDSMHGEKAFAGAGTPPAFEVKETKPTPYQ